MILRDDSPVWEQGFTFLVANPDNDVLQIKIYDQKTGNEIGQFAYILGQLLSKKNMEIMSQPYQLQKSGPESKLTMALSMRIIKNVVDGDENAVGSEDAAGQLSRSSSTAPKTPTSELAAKVGFVHSDPIC